MLLHSSKRDGNLLPEERVWQVKITPRRKLVERNKDSLNLNCCGNTREEKTTGDKRRQTNMSLERKRKKNGEGVGNVGDEQRFL